MSMGAMKSGRRDISRSSFRAGLTERRAIHPERWKILAPRVGSRAALSIVFDRIMYSGAARRLLRVENAEGQTITGEIATDGRGWS